MYVGERVTDPSAFAGGGTGEERATGEAGWGIPAAIQPDLVGSQLVSQPVSAQPAELDQEEGEEESSPGWGLSKAGVGGAQLQLPRLAFQNSAASRLRYERSELGSKRNKSQSHPHLPYQSPQPPSHSTATDGRHRSQEQLPPHPAV